jgi:hypothetical protein
VCPDCAGDALPGGCGQSWVLATLGCSGRWVLRKLGAREVGCSGRWVLHTLCARGAVCRPWRLPPVRLWTSGGRASWIAVLSAGVNGTLAAHPTRRPAGVRAQRASPAPAWYRLPARSAAQLARATPDLARGRRRTGADRAPARRGERRRRVSTSARNVLCRRRPRLPHPVRVTRSGQGSLPHLSNPLDCRQPRAGCFIRQYSVDSWRRHARRLTQRAEVHRGGLTRS